MSSTQQILFVGLGSPHGDDQIGWLVADRLAESHELPPDVAIRKAAIPLDLLDWLEGVDCLHVCDASERPKKVLECGDLSPLSCFETRSSDFVAFPALARLRCSGSHDFGLASVLDLAQRLNRLPPRIFIWAIAGRCFDTGQPVSKELIRALPDFNNTIFAELNHARNVARAVVVDSG